MSALLAAIALLLFWQHRRQDREIERQNIALGHSGERQLARGATLGYAKGSRAYIEGWDAALAAVKRGE